MATPPPIPQGASASPRLPICPGCGIVALPEHANCPACNAPIGSAPIQVQRVHDECIWAAARASFKCRACGGIAPVDGLDVKGPYPCIHCGIDQHMEESQWRDALHDAHTVADLAGPGEGAFGHVAHVEDNEYRRVGRDSVEAAVDAYPSSRDMALHFEVSPGNPLCETCHVPLEIASSGDPLVVRCPRCQESHSYVRPTGVSGDVVGVVGHHHEQGIQDVTTDRSAGGAVEICCPSCNAPLEAAKVGAAVTCAYCGVTSRIGPAVRHAMGDQDATPPRWWVLFRGPSSERRAAQNKVEQFRKEAAAAAKKEAEKEHHLPEPPRAVPIRMVFAELFKSRSWFDLGAYVWVLFMVATVLNGVWTSHPALFPPIGLAVIAVLVGLRLFKVRKRVALLRWGKVAKVVSVRSDEIWGESSSGVKTPVATGWQVDRQVEDLDPYKNYIKYAAQPTANDAPRYEGELYIRGPKYRGGIILYHPRKPWIAACVDQFASDFDVRPDGRFIGRFRPDLWSSGFILTAATLGWLALIGYFAETHHFPFFF